MPPSPEMMGVILSLLGGGYNATPTLRGCSDPPQFQVSSEVGGCDAPQ